MSRELENWACGRTGVNRLRRRREDISIRFSRRSRGRSEPRHDRIGIMAVRCVLVTQRITDRGRPLLPALKNVEGSSALAAICRTGISLGGWWARPSSTGGAAFIQRSSSAWPRDRARRCGEQIDHLAAAGALVPQSYPSCCVLAAPSFPSIMRRRHDGRAKLLLNRPSLTRPARLTLRAGGPGSSTPDVRSTDALADSAPDPCVFGVSYPPVAMAVTSQQDGRARLLVCVKATGQVRTLSMRSFFSMHISARFCGRVGRP